MNKLRFRRLNQLYAYFRGFSWLQCPICKEYFGGHETAFAFLVLSSGESLPVCKKISCTVQAHILNLTKFGKTIDLPSGKIYELEKLLK